MMLLILTDTNYGWTQLHKTESDDIWSEWLKRRRFGGDENVQQKAFKEYKRLATEIVSKAQIFESATVLDIGAGDGIVGLTALEKLGATGKLILSDISEAALAIPKEVFKQNKDPRVEFLISGIEDLSSLKSESVDRIVMRSVLMYAKDKQKSINEIYRVLKPRCVAVILEPINQRHIEFRNGLFRGYRLDCEPLLSVQLLLKKVIDESDRLIQKEQSALIGYNEHDLVHMAIKSNFVEIILEYSLIYSTVGHNTSWDFFFDSAPNPRAETLQEIMKAVLNQEEFDKVVEALKKVFQQPVTRTRSDALLIMKT